MREKLKDRYLILAFCYLLFGFIMIFRLIDLQVVNGEKYNENSQKRVLREMPVAADRGKIFDRYGVPIAVNRPAYTVQIVKTNMSNDDFNEMLLRLANIFEKNNDTYYKTLSRYLTFNPITFNNKSQEEIKKWQKNKDLFGLNESEVMQSEEDFFKYLRSKKLQINSKYSDEEAYKIMTLWYEIQQHRWKFDTGNPVCLGKDIDKKTVAEIEERYHKFPGVTTNIEPVRKYIDTKTIAHVLGYVGMINSDQLKEMQDEGYDQNDIIGQAGIEKMAERYLKGKDGRKKVEVDTKGRLMEELNNDSSVPGNIPAIPGNDIILTLDMNLQQVAMESLERNINAIRKMDAKKNFGDANAGAAVAIDVKTGEVLAMASYPSYDPTIFLEGADNKDAQKEIANLFTDSNSPSLNRVIQEVYFPGSTFKPLTAIAALEEGVITKDERILDEGTYEQYGRIFKCLEFPHTGHGYLDLKKALETSCNIYFYKIGIRTTIDNISKWAKFFGLGEYTGIDLPYEGKGTVASKEYKKKTFNENWYPADTASSSIGQLYNKFTPLQIANYIASIANGGKRYKPYVMKKVIKYDGSIVIETKPEYEQIPVKNSTLDAIKEGMVAVTSSIDGTAQNAFKDFPFKVAGKTGTAETGRENKESSNALFVCYAPADDPQIAVAVVVEHGVWGSYTAPIARDILEEYFGLNSQKRFDDKIKHEEAVFVR